MTYQILTDVKQQPVDWQQEGGEQVTIDRKLLIDLISYAYHAEQDFREQAMCTTHDPSDEDSVDYQAVVLKVQDDIRRAKEALHGRPLSQHE